MGASVSVMSAPQVDEDVAAGLHGYAMRDDVVATSAFLQASEGLDIDGRDEYVSFSFSRVQQLSKVVVVWRSLKGYTALHLATDRGNIATVELLLEHGADKTLKVSRVLCRINKMFLLIPTRRDN
jgi:ankyrin repeat protein